jgi:hypothetical protein
VEIGEEFCVEEESDRHMKTEHNITCKPCAGERGTQMQINGFGQEGGQTFPDLSGAIAHMLAAGVPKSDIRYHPKAFLEMQNFKPDSTASFPREFARLMKSVKVEGNKIERLKVETIQAELISHYLPTGISVDQVDDDGNITLTSSQKLIIYRDIC